MAYSHNQLMGDRAKWLRSKDKSGDLVQGTLDMLVLRALIEAPSMATPWPNGSMRLHRMCYAWKKARSIPRCIAWN